MGSIYRKQGSPFFYIAYYLGSNQVHRSTKTTSIREARKILAIEESKVARDEPLIPRQQRFDSLCEQFILEYQNRRRRSMAKAQRSVRYLKTFFGGMKASSITESLVQRYISQRQQARMADASIDRELCALKKILSYAKISTHPRTGQIPIQLLNPKNTRKGFVEPVQFNLLFQALPSYLKIPSLLTFKTGMREEEIFGLRWSQHIDLKNGFINLYPEDTKNQEPRKVKLDDELFAYFLNLHIRRKSDWVFENKKGGRIVDFRWAWKSTCKKIGLPNLLFHDLRRSFAKIGRKAGISETVLMKMGGWKTRSVFERYAIVDEGEIVEGSDKIEKYLEKESSNNFKAIARSLEHQDSMSSTSSKVQ